MCPDLISDEQISALFGRHGVHGPWERLTTTGVANRIYATRDVVLRVATDHPDAVPDARTESVAAPAARAVGIPVPRLVAFDDSRALVDRPYSLWERVHGETLGLFAPDPQAVPQAWRAVGRWLALLHTRVSACSDPLGWLDRPERPTGLEDCVARLASASRIDADAAKEIEGWIAALRPATAERRPRCFLHNDVHAMNLMCARDGVLLAILDWGDAGWGDPVLEWAQIPCAAVPLVLDGYRAEAPALLGDAPEARIIWDKLGYLLSDLAEDSSRPVALDEIRHLVRHSAWRSRASKPI